MSAVKVELFAFFWLKHIATVMCTNLTGTRKYIKQKTRGKCEDNGKIVNEMSVVFYECLNKQNTHKKMNFYY